MTVGGRIVKGARGEEVIDRPLGREEGEHHPEPFTVI